MSGFSLSKKEFGFITVFLLFMFITIYLIPHKIIHDAEGNEKSYYTNYKKLVTAIGVYFMSLYYTIFVYEIFKKYFIEHKDNINTSFRVKDN